MKSVDILVYYIGLIPNSKIFKEFSVETDEKGYIVVDEWCRTNINGVFACGDVTGGLGGVMKIVTAVTRGVIAAENAYKYLKSPYWAKENLTRKQSALSRIVLS